MAEALSRANLADRADDVVSGFSRGMRQRLALERALLHRPRLLLLDEPFTGLDDASGQALVARLRGLRDQGGIVLVATHDLDLAEGLLDRVAVLRDGRLLPVAGSTASLRDRYRETIRSPAQNGERPVRGTGREGLVSDFLRVAWIVMRKDLTVEMRSREIIYTTMFFAASCVLVFAFALIREGRPMEDAAAGILWIAIAFAGTLGLGRTFERERHTETLRALMLAPSDRPAIYVGKLLGMLALLAVVEAVLVPLVGVLFHVPFFASPWWLLALLGTGTLGFASVGTLFAAMLVRARSRDVLLPVLLYPITIPVIIAGVRGTAALLQATPDEPMARFWAALLVFFDVVFVTLSLWTFEPLMTE